jgi:uncharacterized SAM-binding protein YcdF (DUF218 family)
VNDLFSAWGLLHWKPVASALLLPPVPWLVLIGLGCWTRPRRNRLGSLLVASALIGLWLSHCQAVGLMLQQRISPATALTAAQITALGQRMAGRKPVVLVLGGGVLRLAPEYGEAHLTDGSAERLRYGLWLAQQVHAPLMFSGGVGRGQADSDSEATVAARMALRDHHLSLRWLETASRDTRENARLSLQKLRAEGVTDLLLVTHGWHMRRALRAFEQEAARIGLTARIVAAPMGLGINEMAPVQRWLPSIDGYQRVYQALHEGLGLLSGA